MYKIKVSKSLISIHFTDYQELIIIDPLVTNDSYLVLPAHSVYAKGLTYPLSNIIWRNSRSLPSPLFTINLENRESSLSDQMFDMVSDKQRPQRPQQKRRERSCGPVAITSFDRGSKLEKGIPKCLTDVESEHYVKFCIKQQVTDASMVLTKFKDSCFILKRP